MHDKNEMARNLLAQEPGRETRHGNAANTSKLAQRKGKRHNAGTPYRITPNAGEPFRIIVTGRVRWALDLLRSRGDAGATSFDTPAPRLSAYVHSLRELGVEIQTLNELHEGDYPGIHGRYVLRSDVALDWNGGAA